MCCTKAAVEVALMSELSAGEFTITS
jgi:hypothetical protein